MVFLLVLVLSMRVLVMMGVNFVFVALLTKARKSRRRYIETGTIVAVARIAPSR